MGENNPGIIKFEYDGLKLIRVDPPTNIDYNELSKFDAIIAGFTKEEDMQNAIMELRAQNKQELFLKPVFIYNPLQRQTSLTPLFDGEVDSLRQLADIVAKIKPKIKNIAKLTKKNIGSSLSSFTLSNDPTFQNYFLDQLNNFTGFDSNQLIQSKKQLKQLFLNDYIKEDVLFVDIDSSGQADKDFFKYLENTNDIEIVFISRDEKFALKAFQYNILDYLLKPTSKQQLSRIYNKLSENHQQPKANELADENIILKKMLAYLYSRQYKVFTPVRNPQSMLGHSYPMLTANIGFKNVQQHFKILKQAETEGYLNSTYFDTVYLCNNCSNGFMHYRETCPECKSSNLDQQDLIHHFRCAYVGPESDFKENGNHTYALGCPKCNQKLKHIGVDYDKPAVVYNCCNCEEVFQDPVVRAKCTVCNSDDPVEYLTRFKLFSYHLTPKGTEIVEGKQSLFSKENTNSSANEVNFFQFLVKEIERLRTAEFDSCLAYINFQNITPLYSKIGSQKTKKLKKEIYNVIDAGLPISAEINFNDPTLPLLIIPEKNAVMSRSILADTKQQLEELLNDNFNDFDSDISFWVLPISENKSPREHLDALKATDSSTTNNTPS